MGRDHRTRNLPGARQPRSGSAGSAARTGATPRSRPEPRATARATATPGCDARSQTCKALFQETEAPAARNAAENLRAASSAWNPDCCDPSFRLVCQIPYALSPEHLLGRSPDNAAGTYSAAVWTDTHPKPAPTAQQISHLPDQHISTTCRTQLSRAIISRSSPSSARPRFVWRKPGILAGTSSVIGTLRPGVLILLKRSSSDESHRIS